MSVADPGFDLALGGRGLCQWGWGGYKIVESNDD